MVANMPLRKLTPPILAGSLLAGAALAAEPDLELGEYLAAECTSCHRADAVNVGIPAIFGMPASVFTRRMGLYRDGTRRNEIMRNIARSLSDAEVAALAAYLERARPPY